MTAVSLQTLHALGWTLLHFVWQGAALAALLAAALMVSRNANVRYALGLATLILMLAAPAITFAWLSRSPTPIAALDMEPNRAPSSPAAIDVRPDRASSSLAALDMRLDRASSSVAALNMEPNCAPTSVAGDEMAFNRASSRVAGDEMWPKQASPSAADDEMWPKQASPSAADDEMWLKHSASSVADDDMWLNRASSSAASVEEPVTSTARGVTSTPAAVSWLDRLVHKLGASTNRADMMLWLVQAWFVGVMLLSVRTAGGLFWLARTRRGEVEPLSEEMYRQCLIVQQRMGLQRRIRYGQSSSLDSPVVLGWFHPIVIVTTQALTGLSPQQLQAIIAHELAHIRRYDAFVNLFQVVAEMFLFYHPAVWWVSRRIRIEREVCCDHAALAACGEPVSYARALTMMEEWRASPAMLMAANRGPLTERVLRLLGMQGTSARSRAAGLGACVLGVAAALFAGSLFVAAAQATPDEQSPVIAQVTPDLKTSPVIGQATPSLETSPVIDQATPDDQTLPVTAQPEPRAAAVPVPVAVPDPAPAPQPAPRMQQQPGKPAPPPRMQEPRLPKPAAPARPPQEAHPGKTAAPTRPAREARGAGEATSKSSYIAGIEAAGLRDVSIDELIAMKVQGITPAYIEAVMATTQLHPGVDQLIAMKVHGITPEYIEQTRKLVAEMSIDRIIAMKVSGITPDYIRDMQAAGIDIRKADEFIAAKVQGITPELVKSAIERGFHDLSIDKLMMLRNIDVI